MATRVAGARLDLTRAQILAFRRKAGGLDARRARRPESLRQAAWAGLQDSMPRAALLSIHARVEDAEPSIWEDPALVQVWGPRFSVFVVATQDVAVFTRGTLPDEARRRRRAEDLAARIGDVLAGTRTSSPRTRRRSALPCSLRHARGCCPAAMPISCGTEPIATCWSRPLSAAARCGLRASGPAPCSSQGRSPGRGAGPTR